MGLLKLNLSLPKAKGEAEAKVGTVGGAVPTIASLATGRYTGRYGRVRFDFLYYHRKIFYLLGWNYVDTPTQRREYIAGADAP